MGNDNATLAEAIGRLDRHESIGPHVVPAGFIEGKSQFNASGGILVDSLDGARQAVDFYAQRGYPQIKIYNSFKPEWVKDTAVYALELYVKAGIPANEVLRIATWNGATYARVLGDRGSIDRGKRADLILIDGDPTQDISSIRNVALVLQD